ncbi:hypothetical protein [Chitinilyticum aquatile]|uniref:hypothetical protein n=1 Tax=Chitinilyticum aquatile TaxID=362520 RepID=UPI00054E7742|nr:hypothetical protein [Chitinilyticum aquatile]
MPHYWLSKSKLENDIEKLAHISSHDGAIDIDYFGPNRSFDKKTGIFPHEKFTTTEETIFIFAVISIGNEITNSDVHARTIYQNATNNTRPENFHFLNITTDEGTANIVQTNM